MAADGETALAVTASEEDPHTLVVSGTIAEGSSQLTIHRVDDGAEWARALFIEALQRAGVSVDVPASGPNDSPGCLPPTAIRRARSWPRWSLRRCQRCGR